MKIVLFPLLTIFFVSIISDCFASKNAQPKDIYGQFVHAIKTKNTKDIIRYGENFIEACKSEAWHEKPLTTHLTSEMLSANKGLIVVLPFALPIWAITDLLNTVSDPKDIFPNKNFTGLGKYISKSEEATLYSHLANAYDESDKKDKAISFYSKFIEVQESFRLTISREDRRIGFFVRYEKAIERLIILLLETRKVDEALRYIELSKSKTIREALLSSQAGKLHRKEIRKVNMAQATVELTLAKQFFNSKDKAKIQRVISDLTVANAGVRNKKAYFLERQLATPQFSPSLLDFLKSKTVAIDYFVGDNFICAIAIKSKKIAKFFFTLINKNELIKDIKILNEAIQMDDKKLLIAKAEKLYDVLIRPFDSILDNRIIFSSHGPLHNLPFAALYNGTFICENFELSSVYSLSFLTLLNKIYKKRKEFDDCEINCLVLGDPVNVKFKGMSLEGARKEAKFLAKTLTTFPNVKNCDLVLGQSASEDFFKSNCTKFNIFHFATHSFFSPDDAEKSFILLSDANNDGLLFAEEIYDLKFSGSIELVVMSSCESGASEIRHGDDLFGLTRSWYYAGAKRILSSFFPVKDNATFEFMKTFYISLGRNNKFVTGALKETYKCLIQKNDFNCLAFRLDGLP